jgi:putative DNA primase/helicase
MNDTIQFVPLDKYITKDGSAPSLHRDQKLNELAEMSPVEYGQQRQALADKLGTSPTFLDLEYKERRKRAKAGAEESDTAFLRDHDPWPESVDGAYLLDLLSKTALSHLVLPNGAAEATALWVLFAHAHDCFDISPVLGVTSPTPECGKTSLLTLLGGLVPRALPASNITAAALFRAVEKWTPTLLVDEADTFLRDSDELRGILNSGHQRGSAFVIRTTGDNHEPKRFRTWAPKAVALIGKLPVTLGSRAIHIEMRRKTAAETVKPLRLDRLGHLDPLLRQAARWAADNAAALRKADPKMPKALYGRAADNWRSLLAIADIAGREWPERARRVAESLSGRCIEQTAGVMLLDDIRRIFAERGDDQIASASLIDSLVAMEERPWPEWKAGRPITPRQLAKMLEPFEIRPGQLWTGHGNQRGYEVAHFSDAFTRYLGNLSASPLDPNESAIFDELYPLEGFRALADTDAKKPSKSADSSGLADKNPHEAGFRDGADPFASLKDDSLKLKMEPGGGDYPDLPAFLDRRAAQG